MSNVLPCYRMLNQQRIDGVLSLRRGLVHFEADFPSRHREHLPLHRLLGHQTEAGQLQLFSDLGMLIFYPLESTEAWLDALHEHWQPNRDALQMDEFSGLIPLYEEQEEPDFLAYLEGQWQVEAAPPHPCAIQVYEHGLSLFLRGQAPTFISLKDIQSLECTRHLWKDQAVLSLQMESNTQQFYGSHATQLWAFIHTLKSNTTPVKVWTDKATWWRRPQTWVIASDGLWSFEPSHWQTPEPVCTPWSHIHQINFQKERLILDTIDGPLWVGQRYSNHFYRNLVEQLLEQICVASNTMAIWKDNRIVDIVNVQLRENVLWISAHEGVNDKEPLIHPLSQLWIPEIHDRNSAFVQLRVADTEPTPKWLIIHCGSADCANEWLNMLNIPSRRIKWSNISIPVREGLFEARPAKCCSSQHQEISGQLVWRQNRLAFQTDKEIPLDVPLTFFFDDGRQQFRIVSAAIEHQDIPFAQWNLETPQTLDVYNLRAYHRLPTHWEVSLSPIEWTAHGWTVQLDLTQQGVMIDMSIAGCAIQTPLDISESNVWLVQLNLWDETHQFLCIQQNSTPLQDGQWRSGFQFALPHMQLLQTLWRTLQREHNQHSERTP